MIFNNKFYYNLMTKIQFWVSNQSTQYYSNHFFSFLLCQREEQEDESEEFAELFENGISYVEGR